MGGKTGTTTSQVQIPKEVLARYTAVNNRAEQAASNPFQQYSTDPNAFVAPLNSTQQAGIANTNASAGMAQPYFGAATEAYGQGLGAAVPFTLAGGQAVDPSNLDASAINKYMSPYLSTVLGTTMAAQGQQNAQQRSAMQGNAISAGAFGGDRAGVGQANLAYQQNLSNSQTIANLLNQGYGQALSTAQQQQGVGLGAAQANRAALGQTGQQLYNQFTGYGQGLAGLGTGAQQAALQGAQAQLAAGQTQQQTEQAGKSALYNQFLQQQSYPFQTAQFLANIAEGTGALSGSTTSTTQPMPFFSDERLKEDIEPIGKTFDGQNIVKFRYRGEKQKQLGLVAQDVERHHPEAVGQSHGYKTVDYDAATEESARRGRAYGGGLNPESMGGVVNLDDYRKGFLGGGLVGNDDLQRLIAQQQQMYGSLPWAQAGLYGGSPTTGPRGGDKGGYVPAASLHVPGLVTAKAPTSAPQSGLSQLTGLANTIKTGQSLAEGAEGLADSRLGKGVSNLVQGRSWNGLAPSESDLETLQPPREPKADGGLVGDDEDTPEGMYKHPAGLTIPNTNPQAKLAPAQTPNGTAPGGLGSALMGGASLISAGKTLGSAASGLGTMFGKLGALGADKAAEAVGTLGAEKAAELAGGLGLEKVAETLPFLLLNRGGAVPRQGLAGGGEPEDPNAIPSIIAAAAERNGIPLKLANAIFQQESDLNPRIVGDSGQSVGLGQIKASTAAQPGYGVEPLPLDRRTDPAANANFAMEYLAKKARHLGYDPQNEAHWQNVAEAYNGGGDPRYWQNVSRRMGAEAAPAAGLAAAARSEAPVATAGLAPPANATEANISTNTTAPPARWEGSPENVASNRALQGRRLAEEQNPSWFSRNKEWIVPILSGAGAMASSNSRYLGSALLQGLGAGAVSAANMDYKTQKQNAEVAEQFNRTTLEGERIPGIQAMAQREGVFALPGALPLPMQATPGGIRPYSSSNQPPAVAPPKAPEAPVAPSLPPAPGAAPTPPAEQATPIQAAVTPNGYQYTITAGPNQRLREQVAKTDVADPNNPLALAIYAASIGKPQADLDTKIAQSTLESAPGATMGRSNLNTQTQALMSLSPDSWMGQGPGFETRIAAGRAYNFLVTRAPETAARLGFAPLSEEQM